MRYLFVHQNFPGQFKFLAPALARMGHSVVGMKLGNVRETSWAGVQLLGYRVKRGSATAIHPWAADFESKVIRGEACFRAALDLKAQGFSPDVIVAHPGWGESLFVKDAWPKSRLGLYCEWHYSLHGKDVGFDPEFPVDDAGEVARLRLKNVNNILHFEVADGGLSPTQWQADTFPPAFRDKITVVHDGIDTTVVAPNPGARLRVPRADGELLLTRQREVITFVNRHLEPHRGYHIFMRALPKLLKERKEAQVLIVGGSGAGYGLHAPNGKTWRDIYAEEVRLKIAEADWARVHFLGNIAYDSFLRLLQVSTVHVYLTYPFVLSWSLLEAMSAGCAIVASDTPPVREVIRHDDTGRLVDFFDASALSHEVIRLLEDPTTRTRLGYNARHFAIGRFDRKSVCLPQQLGWVDRLSG